MGSIDRKQDWGPRMPAPSRGVSNQRLPVLIWLFSGRMEGNPSGGFSRIDVFRDGEGNVLVVVLQGYRRRGRARSDGHRPFISLFISMLRPLDGLFLTKRY